MSHPFIDKIFTPRKIGFLVLVANFILFLLQPSFLKQLELKVFDFQLQIRSHFFSSAAERESQVVILDIDEKALKKFGRFPWPRDIMAAVFERVHGFKPKVVALDLLFSEHSSVSQSDTQLLLKWIEQKRPQFSGDISQLDRLAFDNFLMGLNQQVSQISDSKSTAQDEALARVLGNRQNTVLGFQMNQDADPAKTIDKRIQSLSRQSICNSLSKNTNIFRLRNVVTNLDMFSKFPQAQGYINIIPDIDGSIRQNTMLLGVGQKIFPSLALRAAANGMGEDITCITDGNDILTLKIGKTSIPLGEHGQMLIDYPGSKKRFSYLSIADLMENKLTRKDFEGKYVLVGSSAAGLLDLRVTPFSRAFPGVEIHATTIDNILAKQFLHHSVTASGIEMLLLLFAGLISVGFLGSLGSLGAAGFSCILTILVLGGQFALMLKTGEVYFIFATLLTILSIYVSMTLVHFFFSEKREDSEKRRREQIKDAFQHYVSATLVEEIIREPHLLKLGGERRELTVLFSDIRGFTTISERLTPEALADLLNEYLTPMTDIILARRGLLDKYMGDAIMAVFGAPLHFPEHASVACLAAIEMSQQLKILQAHWRERNIPPLHVGVGLNTGEMSVGNMGSKQRFDYTVIGDHVNLGSRLEGTNKFYGTEIIVSEFTKKAAGDGFLFRELDRLQVKGKNQGVTIFELLCTQAEATAFLRELCERFSEALAAYRNANWDRAQKLFESILAFHPEDKPSRLFLERISHFRIAPPPKDWVGVFEMKTK